MPLLLSLSFLCYITFTINTLILSIRSIDLEKYINFAIAIKSTSLAMYDCEDMFFRELHCS